MYTTYEIYDFKRGNYDFKRRLMPFVRSIPREHHGATAAVQRLGGCDWRDKDRQPSRSLCRIGTEIQEPP